MANKKTKRKPALIKTDEQNVIIEKTPETSDDSQTFDDSQTLQTVEIFDKKSYESERFWFFGGSFVIIVAAFLRFYWLSLKPFHHDEGVNGYFLIELVRKGIYKYNPENYHGPTLYYLSLFSTYLFGLTDFGLRFVPAIFGVFVVVAALSLRRYLGTIGALTAAMLLALSPGMVYISRYFIHEIPFVFFTLAAVVCVVKFIENRAAGIVAIGVMSLIIITCLFPGTINFANYIGADDESIKVAAGLFFFALSGGIVYLLMRSLLAWRSGSPVYLMLAAAAVSMTFATKETAFVSFGTILIAIVCVAVWQKIWQKIWRSDSTKKLTWSEGTDFTLKSFVNAFGKFDDAIWMIILSIVVFAVVAALFFSSFFAYREGISGAFEAYAFWSKTSSQDHASNGYKAYLWWMLNLESPLVVLSALGTLIAFWKAKHRFAMFAGLWAFGLFAAYTLIKYKTPWLALSFTMPMALIGGFAINELAVSRRNWQRGAAAFLAAVAFGVCAYQTLELNFYRYDDDSKPYVYAHTKRGFLDLVREIDRFAELSGKGKESQIIVVSPDYWSLPWYLRNYPNAAFFGKFPEEDSSAAEIVIGGTTQAEKLALDYSPYYDYKGTFPLRPGVELMLYVRNDIGK